MRERLTAIGLMSPAGRGLRFGGLDYLAWYARIRLRGKRLARVAAKSGATGPRVVISLTTIPSRIGRIHPALNSLLLQTRPADAIYLHVPRVSLREGQGYTVPKAVSRHPRITVHRTVNDLGPVMKLLPTLELEPDPGTLIITVDDDAVYPRDMVETLLAYHRVLPESALGFRGWDIPRSGRYRETHTRYAGEARRPRRVDVLTGVSGVLYLRGHFGADVYSTHGLPAEAFFVDDLRIQGYLRRRGVDRHIVPHPVGEPLCRYLLPSRSNPLWRINRGGRNNQAMIDALFRS